MAPPSDEHIDVSEIGYRGGDDSPPLIAKVSDAPVAAYGGVTSTARTLSPQYIAFVYRAREMRNGN